MHVISKEIGFDAGHRVPLHESKCRNPHGHRYRLLAYCSGDLQTSGAASGMVVDFGDLKAAMMEVHDVFDHGMIIAEHDEEMMNVYFPFRFDDGLPSHRDEARHGWKVIVVPFDPTVENLAKHIFMLLQYQLAIMKFPCQLDMVELWETPTSMALYKQ